MLEKSHSGFVVRKSILDIFKMSILQKPIADRTKKNVIFRFVIIMLSFSKTCEKCCYHNFFNIFRKNDLDKNMALK